ncbi:1-aminocyclopropane-1-carboxylate deaminase/D-cysteine desulfhydrase [Collimonas pratensis]|uniref:Pyridoxal-phosphate dependent enzyme family protein n=1 Tax=Collimonas pratensis TaxID=279113 RepID=A0A127QRW6_9BURK|nr:pyridoxal-phosphate dependent enzyme [Collimonas pratensis]AMP02491.1 pyridoxal-phosphate dependent enzyme family protein [Collimonas pratensis]AMP12392.1 pyridoxal-phosphate dependent enzyme family protein [Collimonas pratensis]NKI70925.1 pyridoxal-phosphate dependent enzyme [Collimonas pratensis]
MLIPASPSPCQLIESSAFLGRRIWLKRDDLLHAEVSGNKFRKLKYPLLALQGRDPVLVTMGGPWSNHLHALAHAAALGGWPSIGLVRGAAEMKSATLDDCRRLGMQIRFVSREDYRQLRADAQAWRRHVVSAGDNHVWLPEGGSAPAALRGVAEMVDEIEQQLQFMPEVIMVACGTGATLAGILAGLRGRGRVIGVAVLKDAAYLRQEIAHLLQQAGYPDYQNYQLITDAHHGGYGKAPPELRQFCRDFTQALDVPVEPVYTGKLFHALRELQQAQAFREDERMLAVHTGGMQGARGFID